MCDSLGIVTSVRFGSEAPCQSSIYSTAALGSLAALQDNISRMSALGRIADIPETDFESSRLSVRFHPKRSLDQPNNRQFEGQLAARSGRSIALLCAAVTGRVACSGFVDIRRDQKRRYLRVLFFELDENKFPTIAKIRTRSPYSGDREDPAPPHAPEAVGRPR